MMKQLRRAIFLLLYAFVTLTLFPQEKISCTWIADRGDGTYRNMDGKIFISLGQSFTAREGKWIGAKMGLFCSRPVSNNDGGRVVVDSFIVE